MVSVEETRKILEETGFYQTYSKTHPLTKSFMACKWYYQIQLGEFSYLSVLFLDNPQNYTDVKNMILEQKIKPYSHLDFEFKQYDKIMGFRTFAPALLISDVYLLIKKGDVDISERGDGRGKYFGQPNKGFAILGRISLPKLADSVFHIYEGKLRPLIHLIISNADELKTLLEKTKFVFSGEIRPIEDKLQSSLFDPFEKVDEFLRSFEI